MWPRTASLNTLGLSCGGGGGSVRARFLDVAAMRLETSLLQQGSSAAAQRWRAFVQGWANVQGHCCEHAVRRLSACTLPYDDMPEQHS